MGYTTDFYGQFEVTPALEPAHRAYLQRFSETRRMRRNAAITATLPDPIREAADLLIGPEGAYYVGDVDRFGQSQAPDVVDYNYPPGEQPGLWCQWTPTEDGTAIVWDEGEKFYAYVEWLQYLIDTFLKPWGYALNGTVEWEGEDREDFGKIVVANNAVTTRQGIRTYEEED